MITDAMSSAQNKITTVYVSNNPEVNLSIMAALLASENPENIAEGKLMKIILDEGLPPGMYAIRKVWNGIDFSYQPISPPQLSYPSH